ncbi:MAG: sigma factor G inhibitor Gin [Clostridia bacterium]
MRSSVYHDRNSHEACDPSRRRECLVCGSPGIDGPVILGRRLCAGCERAIVSLDAASPDYDLFVERIREAWRAYVHGRE